MHVSAGHIAGFADGSDLIPGIDHSFRLAPDFPDSYADI